MSLSVVPRPGAVSAQPGGALALGRKLADEGETGIGPLVESGDATDVVEDGWIAAITRGNPQYEAQLRENMRLVKQSLAGDAPSALEEVLIDNMMSQWLQKNYLGDVFTKGLLGDLGAVVSAPGGERMLATWIKIIDVPMSRFNQSLRILLLLREQASSGVGPSAIAPTSAAGAPINPDAAAGAADQALIAGQTQLSATQAELDPAAVAPPVRPPGILLPGAEPDGSLGNPFPPGS